MITPIFGDFTLSSGKHSNIYFDVKSDLLKPNNLIFVAKKLVDFIPKNTKSVGGVELGSVPIISAILTITNLNGFIIRKESKSHGTKKIIEGNVIPPVVLVDDVITTGKNVNYAINLLGTEISAIISVVDRNFKTNFPYFYLYNESYFQNK